MRLSALAFLMIVTTVVLAGCAQERIASLEDRSQGYFGKSRPFPTDQLSAVQLTDKVAVTDITPPTHRVNTRNTLRYTPIQAAWQWPVRGPILQSYGIQREGVASEGITIAAAEGEPIRAAQSGEVAYVGQNIRDYGNMVILRHADGALTSYAHARAITVIKGQHVAVGEPLGFVGKTGSAKTPQLHFAVREGTRTVDPLSKLPHDLATN